MPFSTMGILNYQVRTLFGKEASMWFVAIVIMTMVILNVWLANLGTLPLLRRMVICIISISRGIDWIYLPKKQMRIFAFMGICTALPLGEMVKPFLSTQEACHNHVAMYKKNCTPKLRLHRILSR